MKKMIRNSLFVAVGFAAIIAIGTAALATVYDDYVVSRPSAQSRAKLNVITWSHDFVEDGVVDAVYDVWKVIYVPAGTLVSAVSLEVVTPVGATATLGVGDTSNSNLYFVGADINPAAATSLNGDGADGSTTTTIVQKYYSTNDWITVRWVNASTNGKVRVTAVLDKMVGP